MWALQWALGVSTPFQMMACMLSVLLTSLHHFAGDVAISSAKFILVSSNLYTLLTLADLSCKVFNRIKFNFVRRLQLPCNMHSQISFDPVIQLWAIVYNLIAVPMAAGVIYPAGHVRLSPVWSSLAMALS